MDYTKWDKFEKEDDGSDFLARATDIEAKVRALVEGRIDPDDPSLRLPDEDEEDIAAERAERAKRTALAALSEDEQKAERARRRDASELRLREKRERKKAAEKDNWWFGVDVCLPRAGDEETVSEAIKVSRRERWENIPSVAKLPAKGAHYASDYAKWDAWLANPDDPDTVETLAAIEAKRQAEQDAKFEELNADFCGGVREDMVKREASQLKKRARATKQRGDGNVHFKSKSYERALECYEAALKTAPWELSTLTNIAQAHIKLAQWEDAVEFCTRAIRVDATSIKAYSRRSLARKSLKRFDGAVEDAEKAVELDPSASALGVALKRTQMQREDAAEEDAARAAMAGGSAGAKTASGGAAADVASVERIAAALVAAEAAAEAVPPKDLAMLQLLCMRSPTLRVALRLHGGVDALCATVKRRGAAHEARRKEAAEEDVEEIVVPGGALESELKALAGAVAALGSACGNRRNAEIVQQSGALRTAAIGVVGADALSLGESVSVAESLAADVRLAHSSLIAECVVVTSCAKWISRYQRGSAVKQLIAALGATPWALIATRDDAAAMRCWALADAVLRTIKAVAEHDAPETAAALSLHGAVAAVCVAIEATQPLVATSLPASRVRELATEIVARLTIVGSEPAAAAAKISKKHAAQMALMSSDPAAAARALLSTLRSPTDTALTKASALGALVNASLEASGTVVDAVCADGALAVLLPLALDGTPNYRDATSMDFEMRYRAARLIARCSSCDAGRRELSEASTLTRLLRAFAAHVAELDTTGDFITRTVADSPATQLAASLIRAVAACVKGSAEARGVLASDAAGGIESIVVALKAQLRFAGRSGNELLLANASSCLVACASHLAETRVVRKLAAAGVVDLLVEVVQHVEYESVKKNGCVALAKLAGDPACSAALREGDGMRMLMDLGRKYC